MSYVKGSQLPSTSTVADTDTLIVTQEGDSKATKKVAKSDLLKEDRIRLANVEKSLENKAEKNHNHDTIYRKIEDSYSKTEIDNKNYLTEHQDITGKQDKLTAGTNITIGDDNTISAAEKIDDTKSSADNTYSSNKIESIKDELQQSIDNIATGGQVNLTNYYTKDEIDNKGFLTEHQDISGKQDKLKIGTNITISDDNTISATEIDDTKSSTISVYSSDKSDKTYESIANYNIDKGTTDISTIGDGTFTGAIGTLNTLVNNVATNEDIASLFS